MKGITKKQKGEVQHLSLKAILLQTGEGITTKLTFYGLSRIRITMPFKALTTFSHSRSHDDVNFEG